MKRIACLILVLVVAVSLGACKEEGNSLRSGYERADNVPVYDFTSGEAVAPEGYGDYTAGSTDFAFGLLFAVANSEDNTVVSPLSAATALSMLANGASDSTRKELRNVLCAGEEQEVINTGNHYLNSRLSFFNTEDAHLTSANSLWLNDSFDVKSAFLQSAVNYYDAEIQRILFSEADAKDKINKWISDNTDGEITDAAGDISEDTVAVIVNAVLFDDEWATPYGEEDISTGTFHGSKGDADASYMTSQEYYLETAYAKGFTKGFANLPLKFAAILPAGDVSLEEFTENLTASRWQALLDSQQTAVFCKASVPEFEIRVNTDLTEPLKKLGITKIFDAEKADFTALSNSDKVYISKVSQDAFVKIDSCGAEAGAATVIQGKSASAPLQEIKELKFDRPFVFVIYDNESGIPVFTGVVNNIE